MPQNSFESQENRGGCPLGTAPASLYFHYGLWQGGRFSWKENQINNDVSAEPSVGRHTLSRRLSHRKGVQGNHRRGGFPEWGVGRASALPFESLEVPSPESVKTTGVVTPMGRVWVGTNSVGWRIPGWVRQPNKDNTTRQEKLHWKIEKKFWWLGTAKNFSILSCNFFWLDIL